MEEILKYIEKTYKEKIDDTYEMTEFEDYYVFSKDNYSLFFNKRNQDVIVYGYPSNKIFVMPRFAKVDKLNKIDANIGRIHELKKGINASHIIIEGTNMETLEPIKIITSTKNIFLNNINDIFEEKKEVVSKTFTPNLDKYGYDLTNDKYIKDPSVGRENELKRIEQVLLYPEKDKSIIIVGDSGCGKTALVKGLAYRIQNGEVPEQLKDLRIISLDVTTLVAGTKYVGTLEEKMKILLDEASQDKNIVLFMDEMHQAISGGRTAENSNSVAEILKPYLDFGRTRVIGATTKEEYVDEIEQNQAFKTRFKKVEINEPNYEVIYQILDDLINKYNGISYSKLDCSLEEKDMYINWLIRSTDKKHRDYFDKSTNPRLVLDIIKEVYAIANINNREYITKEDFIEAINNEDRLSKSGRESAIKELNYLIPNKNECKILQFHKKNTF